MELFQARDNYIITDGYYSLWCNRKDGGIVPRQGVPPTEAFDPLCKGKVYGVIGKIQLFPGSEWKLLVITKRTLLGLFPGNHQVYRIDRIVVLPLAQGEVTDLELDLCDKHQSGGKPKGSGDGQQKGFEKTWQSMKSAVTNIKENVKNTNTPKDIKDREKEKLEKRLLEEILKMFNDSDSFLYSPTGDITSTQQKQCGEHYDRSLPLWKRVDERFFWNKYMLQDLISNEDPLCSRWILPVIQGYCQIAHCINKFEEEEPDDLIEKNRGILPEEEFDLLLISRRSIHRAGTRYKRRGVDEDGEVANFVETEQIVRTEVHSVSFVQVRGSVPIYWSQPGFKYRPPPRLDKDEEETLLAFMSHFAHQLKYYGGVVIVNLIDQTGREKIITDAFMDNILTFNNPLLTYITFDFHEYCRGMKFENVAVLVESIMDVMKDMRYCWTDSKGIICEQRSVFRVNCMDCLDRTNVVQAALARHVMEVQLRKLGKLLPDQNLPADIRASFQEMWANNGDAISRQYAGTAAMKGDFTRTGERRFTGVMKDGYNSANRYYLNRFKAVYRQTVIDAMLGNPLTEDLTQAMAALKDGDEEYPWTMEREECVAQLVIDCQQLLLSESEECLGGWALVDPFYNPEGALNQDQDVILLLTKQAYYVASYDDDAEQVTQYERINLEDVEKIEIGFEPSFKSRYLFIRIHYKLQGSSGYFHTLRTIQHRTPDEARGVLLGIADAFTTARSHKSLGIKIAECNKLDKKKSKSPPEVTQISSKSRLSSWSKPKTKVKSKSSLEAVDGDPTKLRAKNSPINLRSFLRDHLTGITRTYSDPCLAQQDKSEDYKAERKRSGLSSAPISSGSSSSSESDTEESGVLLMRLDQNLEQPMKSATKLECRSDDVLDVLLKTDDNDGDNESSTRVEEDPVELSVCTDNTIHTTDNDVVTTIEDLLEFHTSGDNPQNGTDIPEDIPDEDSRKNGEYGQVYELDSENENSTAYIEGMSEMEDVYPTANVEENSEKEHEETDILLKYENSDGSSIGCTTAEIQDDLSNSQRDEPVDILLKDEKSDGSSIGYTIDEIQDDLSNSQRDEPVDILLKDEKSDGSSIGYTTAEIEDDLSNSQRDEPVDILLKDEKSDGSSIGYTTAEIEDNLSNSQRDEPVEGDTSLDETTLNTEDINKITESYNESKKKLRETPNLLDLSGDNESSGDTLKSDGGANPFIRFGFGGSLRSMTVSFKTSASMSNIEKGANNVDESLEQEANKRFSTGILGNRSPNTSRSGKGNNFAQKSKNFIPELRNKLSMSFSRARSPRLEHKQTSVTSVSVDDTAVEHKKHKRKHKCLTKIIEI